VTTAITVRPAREEELDAAGEIVAGAYAGEPDMVGHDDYLATIRDARSRSRDAEVLVAVDAAGQLLGCVTYVPDPASRWAEVERPGEAGFRMLGVAGEARGRGVGTALVLACVERARAAGRSALAITTTPDRAPAQRLYLELGFRRAPERDLDPVPGVRLLAFVLPL
jgi:ribosomal protein S18 acetylase RimI-like enzyme